MVYKFFDKKTSVGVALLGNKSVVKNQNMSNKELPEELHKPIFRKFEKREVHPLFIDDVWVADLADWHAINKQI